MEGLSGLEEEEYGPAKAELLLQFSEEVTGYLLIAAPVLE